jgi:hypothetical protein
MHNPGAAAVGRLDDGAGSREVDGVGGLVTRARHARGVDDDLRQPTAANAGRQRRFAPLDARGQRLPAARSTIARTVTREPGTTRQCGIPETRWRRSG